MIGGDGRGRALQLLHPALQHHLFATLHWLGLWPLQRRSVEPVLDGEDVLVAAGPGEGRRPALFLPLASRMLSEAWEGVSVLVVAETRARAEALAESFEEIGESVGRSARTWPLSAGVPEPDVLAVPRAALGELARAEGPPASLRALVVEDVAGLAHEPEAATLARFEAESAHAVQRLGWCAPQADADALLRQLSPPGRAGVVARVE